MVVLDMPVARATSEIPPQASDLASDAAHIRRTCSFITGPSD